MTNHILFLVVCPIVYSHTKREKMLSLFYSQLFSPTLLKTTLLSMFCLCLPLAVFVYLSFGHSVFVFVPFAFSLKIKVKIYCSMGSLNDQWVLHCKHTLYVSVCMCVLAWSAWVEVLQCSVKLGFWATLWPPSWSASYVCLSRFLFLPSLVSSLSQIQPLAIPHTQAHAHRMSKSTCVWLVLTVYSQWFYTHFILHNPSLSFNVDFRWFFFWHLKKIVTIK